MAIWIERFWGWLIYAYPVEFRYEYGPEMIRALSDRFHEERGISRAWFCAKASTDIVVTASKEWYYLMIQDFTHSCRRLFAHPGVAAIAILSLALGIGANTTMFSVIYAALLRPLPYPDSDRRVILFTTALNSPNPENRGLVTSSDFIDWRRQSIMLEDLHMFTELQSSTVTGVGLPERIATQQVTVGLLDSLGAKLVIGRRFRLDDKGDHQLGEKQAIISESYWERRFGRQPDVLGRSLVVGDSAFTVIGVIASGFELFNESSPIDVWNLIDLSPGSNWIQRRAPWIWATAKLKPGVTVEQAQAEMSTLAANLAQTYPETNRHRGVAVTPMLEARNGRLGSTLYPLFGAVGFVLLIACVNVANLLLARATVRRREISVRAALGASRGRLIREFLADGLVLAIPGVVAGLALAFGGIALFRAFAPKGYPGTSVVELNLTALLFTAGVAALAGILSAIFPALEGSRVDVAESLKEGGRGSAGRKRQRLRSLLVAGEIALALVLLVGAGLTINSLLRLQNHAVGFDPDNVTIARFDLQGKRYKTDAPHRDIDMRNVEPAVRQFIEHMLREARALPGVEYAAFGGNIPMGPRASPNVRVRVAGRSEPDAELRFTQFNVIAGKFFEVLHIALLRGRYLNEHDTDSAPWVAVVNEKFAREFFPNGDAIGQVVTLIAGPEERSRQIVGVVGDSTEYSPRFPTEPEIYTSHFQQTREIPGNFQGQRFRSSLILKSRLADGPKIETISRIVADFDKNLPVIELKPLDWYIAMRGGSMRFYTNALGLFSLIALVLATIGIYGLMSYSVTDRFHEIGIRLSLGATRARIVWLIVSYGLRLAGIGFAVGIAGALAATRLLNNLLFGIKPWDPMTFFIVTVFLLIVTLTACALPALRATGIDAAVALRRE